MSLHRLFLTGIAVATLALSSAAQAKSIDFDEIGVGDVLVVNGNHELTYDDLLVLAAREDNGWHLGWFKHKEGSGSTALPFPGLFDLASTPLLAPPIVTAPTQTSSTTTASSPTSTPSSATPAASSTSSA